MTNYTAIAPTTNSTLAKTLHQRNHKEDPWRKIKALKKITLVHPNKKLEFKKFTIRLDQSTGTCENNISMLKQWFYYF